jgi:FKBP-type peptidyl-prolyl cis-trans isomerase
MATVSQRIFAASGAIVFFLSSIALTVMVIITVIHDNKDQKQTSSQQKPADNKNKLEGTKLEGFTPVDQVTELKTEDLTVGTGKEVTSVNDTITADYTGALAKTGVIFQSSLDSGQPFTTQLSGVIEGWQKGVIGMKEGGKRRLLVPAAQAYGSQAQQGIPANSDLVFDITLHTVGQ